MRGIQRSESRGVMETSSLHSRASIRAFSCRGALVPTGGSQLLDFSSWMGMETGACMLRMPVKIQMLKTNSPNDDEIEPA